MNKLIYKILGLFIVIFTLVNVPARAQTVTQLVPEDLPSFDRISLGGDFTLSLHYGKQFRVQVDVEELYADYILLAVEDSSLNVSVDDRRVPGDVKRMFRNKDVAQPVFRLSVTMPETLSFLRLTENASLVAADELVFNPDEFAFRATDNATTASFTIPSRRVSLDLDKKSEVLVRSDADTLFVRTAGNSNLTLEQHAKTTVVNSVANASMQFDGETEGMEVHMKGTSKAVFNGRAEKLSFDMANSTNANAISMDCREAHAVMSGICTLALSVNEDLYVDLSHGANLYFLNEPNVHVQYVKNSSIMPYERK